MKVHGIGIISSIGRGVKSFSEALQQGPIAPKSSIYSPITKKEIPFFSVDDALLKDKVVLNKSRRSDRFCKMAVLAAWDAFADSEIEVEANEKIGVIVATAFGPHKTTFNFLDNLLDYGDIGVSPTIFSHSVHNAAASYISSALKISGPVCTITDFCFPFHEACKLADSWINQGRCKYVIVGTVDELSSTMEYICDQKLNIRENGRINPFLFSDKTQTVPGEGSVFFLLSNSNNTAKYCSLTYGDEEKNPDIFILESDGMSLDESIYKDVDTGNAALFNCSSLFGGIMSSTSFHCASAALMLKNNCLYLGFTKEAKRNNNKNTLSNIISVKFCCNKDKSIINLKK